MSISPSDPWLSVVMPTHSGERWLRATLDSLAEQSVGGFECIVIDSSPDSGTRDLIGTYADRLALEVHVRPDLMHWRSKTNFGFQVARAPFVSMLHQDDFWLPGRAARLHEWLVAAPHAAMHLHPALIVDGSGRRLGVWRCPLPSNGRPVPRAFLLERLLVQNFISVPTPAIRRDVYLAVGGIDEALWYTGDWDLYLKLASRGDVFYHPEPQACFRIHGGSLTVSGSRAVEDFERQMLDVLEMHLTALPSDLRSKVRRRALASIAVNTSLAAANNGKLSGVFRALWEIVRLGPLDGFRYLDQSRLLDRLLPRLFARMAGRL